jgi:hypothetical protein
MPAEAYKRTFVIFRFWLCSHESSLPAKEKSSHGLLLIVSDFAVILGEAHQFMEYNEQIELIRAPV